MHKFFLTATCAAMLAAGCKDRTSSSDDLRAVPLKTFKYDSSALKSGTPIGILAFSGGKLGHGNSIYYSQFIVLDRMTLDTLRVLAALMSFDEDSANAKKVIYSPSVSFNGDANVLDATFEPPSGNQNIYLNVMANQPVSTPEGTTTETTPPGEREEFVVIPDKISIFSRPYKTAIGVLHFSRQPW